MYLWWKESHGHGGQACGCLGGGGSGIDWEFGINSCRLFAFGMDR